MASESAYATASHQTVLAGQFVSFDTAEAGFGVDITQTSPTVFTLNAAGVYRVTFNLTVSLSSVAFAVYANGKAVLPATYIISNVTGLTPAPPADATGSVTINATTGETISLGAYEGGTIVVAGSSISVDQLH